MKHIFLGIFFLSSFTISGAQASEKVMTDQKPVTAPGVASMWVNWIKDKGEKFDFEMVIKNESDKGIIVYLYEISCDRGSRHGEVKHTFFNTGERTIDFRPHEQKKFGLVCRHEEEAKGDYKITIGSVYDNPSGDGKITGKKIANNLVWKKADKAE